MVARINRKYHNKSTKRSSFVWAHHKCVHHIHWSSQSKISFANVDAKDNDDNHKRINAYYEPLNNEYLQFIHDEWRHTLGRKWLFSRYLVFGRNISSVTFDRSWRRMKKTKNKKMEKLRFMSGMERWYGHLFRIDEFVDHCCSKWGYLDVVTQMSSYLNRLMFEKRSWRGYRNMMFFSLGRIYRKLLLRWRDFIFLYFGCQFSRLPIGGIIKFIVLLPHKI